MTYRELMAKIDDSYPEGYLGRCAEAPDYGAGLGDTLASFIAREIGETFDPTASDAAQVAAARSVVDTALRELGSVAAALEGLAG